MQASDLERALDLIRPHLKHGGPGAMRAQVGDYVEVLSREMCGKVIETDEHGCTVQIHCLLTPYVSFESVRVITRRDGGKR